MILDVWADCWGDCWADCWGVSTAPATVWGLQQALYDRLQPVLAALDPAVALYDEAEPDAAMPFVEFARHIVTPDDGYTHYLSQDLVTLAVYSDHGGKKQVLQIMEAIRAELTDASLTLDNGSETIRCRYERMDTALDADGRTRIGTIIFSILFEH